MNNQHNISNLAFLMITAIMLAGPKVQAASAIRAFAVNPITGTPLVYERTLNPYIGITADPASIGSTYSISDEHGKIVKTGVIRSAKTFYVATGKLNAGAYTFHIGGYVLQQFIVK